jgi:hypothetical protein
MDGPIRTLTLMELGRPFATSTSTVTGTPESPCTAQLMAVASIQCSIIDETAKRRLSGPTTDDLDSA